MSSEIVNDLNSRCKSLEEMKEAVNQAVKENKECLFEINYKDDLSVSTSLAEKGLFLPDPKSIMELVDKKNYSLEAVRSENGTIHTAFIKIKNRDFKEENTLFVKTGMYDQTIQVIKLPETQEENSEDEETPF